MLKSSNKTKFSIEVMPKTAKRVEDFSKILPLSTLVYVAHLEDTDISDMRYTCQRIIEEGMVPMPHIPARVLKNLAQLEEWVSEYAKIGVSRCLLLAGNNKSPIGDFHSSIQLLETGLFEKHGYVQINVAGHPEGNPDIDRNGDLTKTIAALKIKSDYSQNTHITMEITTQFCFDLVPVKNWLQILERNKISLPVNLGVAGPTRLQTLLKYALICGVGPSISILKKRAKDITKLLLPFEPTDIINEVNGTAASENYKNVKSFHFFPLGGIEKSAFFTKKLQ
jgi:methylenetetrahydrofolate reductase (NADPH)